MVDSVVPLFTKVGLFKELVHFQRDLLLPGLRQGTVHIPDDAVHGLHVGLGVGIFVHLNELFALVEADRVISQTVEPTGIDGGPKELQDGEELGLIVGLEDSEKNKLSSKLRWLRDKSFKSLFRRS